MAEKVVPVTAELPESLYNSLIELAKKRGVSANTVLQQAIVSEQYFSEKEQQGSKILVEDANHKIRKVVRK